MSPFFIGLVIGLFIGVFLGVLVAGLCQASKEQYEDRGNYRTDPERTSMSLSRDGDSTSEPT